MRALLVVLALLFVGPLDAATKVITPTDNLMAAVSSLQPGDILQLRSGSYAGIVNTTIQGTAAARIVIQAYPGETATLRYVSISGGRRLVFRDLSIDGLKAIDETVWIGNGGGYNEFQNCKITNSLALGVNLSKSGVGFNIFRFCEFYVHGGGSNSVYASRGYGIYNSTSDNLFEDSSIHDIFFYGIHSYSGVGGVNRNIYRRLKIYRTGLDTSRASAAILIADGTGNIIDSCEISSNRSGINIAYRTADSQATKNTLSGNGSVDIEVFAGSERTLVSSNCVDPLKIKDSGTSTVKQNNNLTGCGVPVPAPLPSVTGVRVF